MKTKKYYYLLISFSLFSNLIRAQSCPPVSVAASPTAVCAGQTAVLTASGANNTKYTWDDGTLGNVLVVTPNVTTTYTVSSKRGNCLDTKTITVVVNPIPQISVNSGAICAGGSFTMVPSGAATYTFSAGTNVVSPNSTTSYYVTGKSAQGCVSSVPAISMVTVNPLPVITVNSGSICAGKSFTMNPSGAATYTFSCGSAVVNPLISSSYSVSGTSAAGCTNSTAAVCNVTIVPLPVVYAGADQTTYYIYGTAPLCTSLSGIVSGAPGPYQYSWSSGANTSATAVCPTVTSSYTLNVTAKGCVGSDIVNVNVNSGYCSPDKVLICHNGNEICVSQNAVVSHLAHGDYVGHCIDITGTGSTSRLGGSLSIFPNPNNGKFTIDIIKKDPSYPVKIELMNSFGQIVFSGSDEQMNSKEQRVELSTDLPDGIYIVSVVVGEEMNFSKIVLSR